MKSLKKFFKAALITLLALIILWGAAAFSLYKIFYPEKYTDIINKNLTEEINDIYFVLAVIKAESGFDEKAVSEKNAKGLMQITGATAEYVAGILGRTEYDIFSPEDNIEFGIFYLNYLYKKFGNTKTALCAYNAGEGNVKEWLENENFSVDGVTLYRIPFSETEKYVDKILKYYGNYKILY